LAKIFVKMSTPTNTQHETQTPNQEQTITPKSTFQESIEQQLQQNPTFLKFNYGLFTAQEMFHLTSTILISPTCTVRYVDLIGNRLGDEGVATLAQSLRQNTTINYLNLSMNDISSDGAKHLCEAFSNKDIQDGVNRSVEHFDLSVNRLGDLGIGYIVDMLRNNETLVTINVRSNKVKSQQGVSHLLEIMALADNSPTLKDAFI
jgi:Ran GTPase-activating protein (RanGAP) involved in mRNA processing and transport